MADEATFQPPTPRDKRKITESLKSAENRETEEAIREQKRSKKTPSASGTQTPCTPGRKQQGISRSGSQTPGTPGRQCGSGAQTPRS